VKGSSDTSFGIFGQSTSGTALQGQSTNGNGTVGNSVNFNGITGNSTNLYGGVFTGGLAPLLLTPSASLGSGPPSSGTHQKGELYVDALGGLWFCTIGGGPGVAVWVRLSGPQAGTQGGTISYLSTPIRLLDARSSPGSALVTRGPLAANELYPFTVAGLMSSGIPSSAQGLIANVTVLGPASTGNLSLFPSGGAIPSVASMTFGTPALFLANGVNVAIGTGGQITLQNQSSDITPLVLDAVAYVN
jgi:hypothetical protein